MKVGIPTEIKPNESRVSITPGGVLELLKHGDHQIFVQKNAGIQSGFSNSQYEKVGATILPDIESVYGEADLMVKVKEPIPSEYPLIKKNHILFTYFHFASSLALTEAMIKSQSVCIAYETVKGTDGSLPLLIPMSEVAGRMAVQQGARFLEKPVKGRGILLGGVPGVPPGRVLILGAGIAGRQAAKMAAGLGAQVTVMDVNLKTLRYINDVMPENVVTLYSHEHNIRKNVPIHDLIIGTVLIPGAKAPKLVTRDMLKTMRSGTVMVDVAIDQGGCFESSKPTTHEDPIFIEEDIVHYCVTNMPGAVPYTSTVALTNATLPYVLELVKKGWKTAVRENPDLLPGVNIVDGKVTHESVAQAFDLPWERVETVLN